MKINIFLREVNKFKEVEITDSDKPEISNEMLNKWQYIINIIVDIIGVSAGLLIRITSETMEVVLKSENKDNPYEVGGNDSLGHDLYCETTIGNNKELYIQNALENKDWKDNPDIDLDMISYFGLPIKWPDQEIFGTICILDDKTMELDENQKKLLEDFRDIIEDDLNLLINRQDLKTKSKAVETAIAGICFLNMQGEIIYANKSFLEMSGHKKAEEIYNASITPFDLIPKTEFKKIKKAIAATIEKGEWQGESKAIKVNGKVIDIKISTSLVKNNNKQVFMMASFEDITERKEKERILRKQNKKVKQQKDSLDFIIKGTDVGTWEWNVQTGKTNFNDKWAEMLGYELEELKPTSISTWKKYTHPEDLKKAEKNLERHFKEEIDQYDVEIRMKHKDGHWIWVNDRGRVISWTKDKKPLKMFGIHLDITKRKEKEKKLKKTKKLLKSLTDQVPGTIYQHQIFPDGRSCFPYASKGIYEVYEVTPEEVKEDITKVYDRIHPDDYDQVVNSVQKSANNLDNWHDEFRVILPEQGLKWLEGNANPEKLSDGSILWHGNIRDITEEKENELRYQTIFESAPNPIFIIDQNGNYQAVNSKSVQMFGYSRQEFLTKNIRDLVADESLKKGLKATKKLFKTGYMNTEVKVLTKDNKELTITIDAVRLKENRYLGFAKDITKRKEQEKELKILANTMKNISDSVIITDSDFKIQYINKAGEKLFGYTMDELLGESPYIFT
ncbi:MAG: PAS domain S-box protein, partial [Bacillota bacterium]